MSSYKIIENSKVPNYNKVYTVGCFSKRVTFHSQQRRALNLVWALVENEIIRKGDPIAIIGGGLAGMTAAIAADRKGAKVTLFEKHDQLMSLQRQNLTRYVHPNIYDWPKENSFEQETHLPFLNWRADYAGEIVEQIESQWQALSKKISVKLNREIKSVSSIGADLVVKHGIGLEPFACVILAVGFGVEKKMHPVKFRSYWQMDSLNQPELDPRYSKDRKKNILSPVVATADSLMCSG